MQASSSPHPSPRRALPATAAPRPRAHRPKCPTQGISGASWATSSIARSELDAQLPGDLELVVVLARAHRVAVERVAPDARARGDPRRDPGALHAQRELLVQLATEAGADVPREAADRLGRVAAEDRAADAEREVRDQRPGRVECIPVAIDEDVVALERRPAELRAERPARRPDARRGREVALEVRPVDVGGAVARHALHQRDAVADVVLRVEIAEPGDRRHAAAPAIAEQRRDLDATRARLLRQRAAGGGDHEQRSKEQALQPHPDLLVVFRLRERILYRARSADAFRARAGSLP